MKPQNISVQSKQHERRTRNQKKRQKQRRTKLILLTVSAMAAMTVACCEHADSRAEAATEAPEAVQEVSEAVCLTIYPVPLDEGLQTFIVRSCEVRHIDAAVVMAMIEKESSYNASAVGDSGNSLGLMQIQPRWHGERMAELGCDDLLNPYQNVTVGIDYLSELLDRYDGDIEKALTAYNQGSFKGTVTKYATEVLQISNRLKGGVQMVWSDDPIADFNRHEAEQQKKLEQLPVCVDCGEPIQQETAVFLGGEWYCDSCIDAYRMDVEAHEWE